MKNKIILIGIVICISCNKSRVLNIPEIWPLPVYFGSASLRINNSFDNTFLPKAYTYTNGGNVNKYSLQINYYTSNNMLRLSLNFSYFPFKPGIYAITRSVTQPINGIISETLSSYGVLQGDAVEYSYDVDSTKPCILNITSVDSVTKELWGNFQGMYKLKPNNNTNINTTQQVEITNGTFHTKVFE
jgi:hypothetical protein